MWGVLSGSNTFLKYNFSNIDLAVVGKVSHVRNVWPDARILRKVWQHWSYWETYCQVRHLQGMFCESELQGRICYVNNVYYVIHSYKVCCVNHTQSRVYYVSNVMYGCITWITVEGYVINICSIELKWDVMWITLTWCCYVNNRMYEVCTVNLLWPGHDVKLHPHWVSHCLLSLVDFLFWCD